MSDFPSYTRDDYTFRVPISFTADPVDLGAATVEALARGPDGASALITGTAGMTGPAEASGVFPDGTFAAPGVYTIQLRLTLGTITQTVAEWRHSVRPGL